MSKRQFKSQASSSRVDPGISLGGFGAFGTGFTGSKLSYLSESPNLSSITDANVVVAFKNLLKKDSTTKARGLEDLRSYVQAHPYEQDGGVEQPILEAWVKLYPRISIDNSRRVRELSHTLQSELLKSARKRMEKSIPSVVGPWLAGSFDRERSVSRAASDGLTSFLDTEDKLLSFWRRCQPQILAYAQEAIRETPQTLSDERTVSSEEAQAKYDRVIGASLSLLINLLAKLDDGEIQKHQQAYEDFFSGNKILWEFIGSDDSFVRRTTAELLSVCLDKKREIFQKDLELVGHAFIAHGLRRSQSGSSLHFLQALTKLTDKFPHVWLVPYKGKKSPMSKLHLFVEKGSQGGPPEYWACFSSLVLKLPLEVLPKDLDGAVDFLKAQRDGISSRGEARANALAAWMSYFEVVKYFGAQFTDAETYEQLLRITIFPLFEQFLRPVPEHFRWSTGINSKAPTKAFNICSLSQSLSKEWWRLAELLTTTMLTSLPEQARGYAESQTAVSLEAHRWFGLQAEIIKSAGSPDSKTPLQSIITFLAGPCSLVITKALETIVNRKGKPYGAAGALEAALSLTPELVCAVPSIQTAILSFLQNNFSNLVTSPSGEALIASMNTFRLLPKQEDSFAAIWQGAIDAMLAASDSTSKTAAVQGLLSSPATSNLAQQSSDLQNYIFDYASRLVQGQSEDWSIFETSVKSNSLTAETMSEIISMIIDSLDSDATTVDKALHALEFMVKRAPHILRGGDSNQVAVMTRLLSLTESSDPDTIARATALKNAIENVDGATVDTSKSLPPILEIIKDNLEHVHTQSLAIDTLVDQAKNLINTTGGKLSVNLFPNPLLWSEELKPLLGHKPNPALSVTTPIGSAIPIIEPTHRGHSTAYIRDINGYSTAFRMALYTSRLLTETEQFGLLPENHQVQILQLLNLTMVLANDQLSLRAEDQLWSSIADPDIESQGQDFVDSTQISMTAILKHASDWRTDVTDGQSAVARELVSNLIKGARGNSTFAFYSACALNNALSILVEAHGWKSIGGDEWLSALDVLKPSTPDIFTAIALLSGLQDVLRGNQLVGNFCNRLISDIIGETSKGDKPLRLLILLNATLAIYEPGHLPAAQNRIVFAVKQISSWMNEDQNMSAPLAAEVCRCLQFLTPSITEVYGPFWETTLEFVVNMWNRNHSLETLDDLLPAFTSSLRLVVLLRGLRDANDDLTEALAASSESISAGLLRLLSLRRTMENQPWRIFDELLCRQVMGIPLIHIKDLSMVYPMVVSEYHFIQLAAFYTLYQATTAVQEQISVDVVIDKKNARLPDELLSLLLYAPSYSHISEEALAGFPAEIRAYLFSWQLVFASYINASYKVRNDYSELLKSENYISPLLDFLFDVLGHSAGQPLNLDKMSFTPALIQSYDIKLAENESDERNMQWLLVNLYYLCLKFAPNLAKNWWLNCKSKQTRLAVESWTEKYFSPLVIADTLGEVATWAERQEIPSDGEKALIIKVSKKSREIYAGYEIDETQMQIVIRLPANYPLENVKVEGINKVAVSEKKWQSWLMITQGVITFSNGSITDGLITFRKNITGALKGQTECAICYSIISSDKKMPDKRCQTCKNLFHSSCLFKWFSTSNQSTCPLCRNPFNYAADIASRGRQGGRE